MERLWRDMIKYSSYTRAIITMYIYYLAEFLFKKIYNYNEQKNTFFEIMNSMYPLNDLNVN